MSSKPRFVDLGDEGGELSLEGERGQWDRKPDQLTFRDVAH